ncbi:MAG TPA: ATP-binding cassette domain-containing protein, partial [Cytophaga sp.]|nr:ATP-binding cassette domain-containing protein [Cytophaga sp.]
IFSYLYSLKLIFMISIDGLAVAFSGNVLFSDVTFNINDNDRIALMGKNGAGKSTMLKIIAGADKPTRGKVTAPNGAVIAYLPQHLLVKDDSNVFEETSKAFATVLALKKEIDELNHQLETRTDYETDAYMKIIERVSEVSEQYYSIEEVNFDSEVEKTLLGLGFLREDFTRPCS